VDGNISVDTNSFAFTPDSNLSYHSTYTATLTKAIKDINGNALSSDYSWSFTTGVAPDTTPPTLVGTDPTNNATGVQVNSYMTLNFSEAINPSSATSSSIVLKDSNDTTIATAITSDENNASIIKVTPSATLNMGVSYTLTITTGIADLAGNHLESNQTVSFTTLSNVSIQSSSPINGATNVAPYTWIDINFSEEMNSSTLTPETITISGGKECQKVVYLGGENNTARCYPYITTASHKLEDNTTYTVSISTNVKSASGGVVVEGTGFSFTTGRENKLPRLRTGQSTSYTDYDDGWYVTNNLGIERGFTRDAVAGTVTDNATGLIWDDGMHDGAYNWEIAKSSCSGEKRLPAIDELAGIANKGASSPAKFDEFQNISNSTNYWSATEFAKETANWAWRLYFGAGVANSSPKSNSYNYQCVKGDKPPASVYVRDNDNNLVLDTVSGLIWQDNIEAKTATYSWADAITYCESLNLGGYTDWRLPNYSELYSLADKNRYSPAISNIFVFKDSAGYWNSTTNAGNDATALVIDFDDGDDYSSPKSNSRNVRCVRGGL